MNKMLFGKRLNKARKSQQMSSEKLAEKCGVNAVFIRLIECSSRLPSLPVFVQMCNSLHTSPNYLLADSLEPNEQEHLNALWQKLLALTPKQIEMVIAMIDTLVEKME